MRGLAGAFRGSGSDVEDARHAQTPRRQQAALRASRHFEAGTEKRRGSYQPEGKMRPSAESHARAAAQEEATHEGAKALTPGSLPRYPATETPSSVSTALTRSVSCCPRRTDHRDGSSRALSLPTVWLVPGRLARRPGRLTSGAWPSPSRHGSGRRWKLVHDDRLEPIGYTTLSPQVPFKVRGAAPPRPPRSPRDRHQGTWSPVVRASRQLGQGALVAVTWHYRAARVRVPIAEKSHIASRGCPSFIKASTMPSPTDADSADRTFRSRGCRVCDHYLALVRHPIAQQPAADFTRARS